MPEFESFYRRYNTLRLLSYDYSSTWRLCAISLVTDQRRPLFADVRMAKSILSCLLSEQTFELMRLRAFTLMPDHLHLVAGVRDPERKLANVVGLFKSYTTQAYWKRSCEIVKSGRVVLPSMCVDKGASRELISVLMDWGATLRPEVVELKNWPKVRMEQFLRKRLWQTRFWDHVIRNEFDLRENMDYIAMNPVRAGYVSQPQFYPYTGFVC